LANFRSIHNADGFFISLSVGIYREAVIVEIAIFALSGIIAKETRQFFLERKS